MILLIDTTTEIGKVALVETETGHLKAQKEIPDRKKFSEEILSKISELDSDIFLSREISAIAVNIGPGSYTGLRIGVTVANFLALSQDIPVYGYLEGQFDRTREQILSKNSEKKFTSPVLPFYNNPPNITKPKSGR